MDLAENLAGISSLHRSLSSTTAPPPRPPTPPPIPIIATPNLLSSSLCVPDHHHHRILFATLKLSVVAEPNPKSTMFATLESREPCPYRILDDVGCAEEPSTAVRSTSSKAELAPAAADELSTTITFRDSIDSVPTYCVNSSTDGKCG
ncbi:hypothetical protein Droror1_Dr00008694 [Drosera rotundifolia]